MDRPNRRQLLVTGLALAAGVVLPIRVTGSLGMSGEEVEHQALTLAHGAEAMGPATALAAARIQLRSIDHAISQAARASERLPLRRAAATTAIICARASRWCGLDGSEWLTLAQTHAHAANDGPLLARSSHLRGIAAGEEAQLADCGSPAALRLYVDALHRAGSGREQSAIRAAARFSLAWEFAAGGDRRGALMELEAAQFEAQRGGWSQTVIDSAAGPPLRKLGRLREAELRLSAALDSPPVRRAWVLCDLARTYAASGNADRAAETLAEAYLLTRAHRADGRLHHVVAGRSVLPPGRAARELDDIMRGV